MGVEKYKIIDFFNWSAKGYVVEHRVYVVEVAVYTMVVKKLGFITDKGDL